MLCSHVFQHKSNCANVVNVWLTYLCNTVMLDILILSHFVMIRSFWGQGIVCVFNFRMVFKIQYSHLLTAGHHISTIKACTGQWRWKWKVIETKWTCCYDPSHGHPEWPWIVLCWIELYWPLSRLQSTRSVLGPVELKWLIWHDHVIHFE